VSSRRNPIAIRFGENVRSCRIAARVSQEELGWLASLHRTEVGLLERGGRVPRIDTLPKLAGALSVPPSRLLEGIEWTPKKIKTESGGFQPCKQDVNFHSGGQRNDMTAASTRQR
jgi:transcriptional regulator with XRE-family HTH domain